MMKKLLGQVHHGQRGITGLETAIILIAFVVVAAVFAYTVLSAGLFSTQKSQEAVYSGLEEARSTMAIKGSVVASGVQGLNDADTPLAFETNDATDWGISRQSTAANIKEGVGALEITATALSAVGDYAQHKMPVTTTIAAADVVSAWVYASEAISAGDLQIAFDGDGAIVGGETLDVPALTGAGWVYVSGTLSAGSTDATEFGLLYAVDVFAAAATVRLDYVTLNDVSTGLEYLLSDADYPLGWTSADADMTLSRDTSVKKDGSGSLKVAVDAAGSADDVIASHTLASRNFSDGDVISFWIRASVITIGTDLIFHLDNADPIVPATPSQACAIPAMGTADTWTYVTCTLSGGDDTGIVAYGLEYNNDIAAVNINLDMVQAPVPASSRTKMPVTYADTIKITMSNALGGEAINFTATTDSNSDGLLGDETALHYLTVSYSDEYQSVEDLAWTLTKLVDLDTDDLLEANEQFQIVIDLKAVNLAATGLDKDAARKIGPNHEFTIQIRPEQGATLTVERAMGSVVYNSNDLN
jgi:flagellin-like protein